MPKLLLQIAVCFLSGLIVGLLAFGDYDRTIGNVHHIAGDRGGSLARYISKYARWSINGDTVIIEGGCASACTLVLGMIHPEKLCTTARGVLGFHSASRGPAYSPDGTRLMFLIYGDRVAKTLAQHGWPGPTEHPAIIALDARELVRPCTEADLK